MNANLEKTIQALIGGPDTPHGHYYAPRIEDIDAAAALLRAQAAELEALRQQVAYSPTMTLRFVEREETSEVDASGMILPPGTVRVLKRRVLQQLWMSSLQSEWRDVPLVYP